MGRSFLCFIRYQHAIDILASVISLWSSANEINRLIIQFFLSAQENWIEKMKN